MRIALALALLLAAVPAAAQERVETFTLKGAHGYILIPADWNGSLFIYARGYSADSRILQPIPSDLSIGNFGSRLPMLMQASILPALRGYAVAATTFRSVGWYVKDAVKDVENLRRYFVKRYGKPTHTYLWGHSGGGIITAASIEYLPRTYDGAIPMCGLVGGSRRQLNGAFDLRVVYDWVCRDVPAARFACGVCSDGATRCLADADCPAGGTCGDLEPPTPSEEGLSEACTDFLLARPELITEDAGSPSGGFVAERVTPCFGNLAPGGARTAEQEARRDLFVRATQIPADYIATDLFFASVGLAEVVHRRTNGKLPWGNEGLDYASPLLTPDERAALNAGVARVREDAAAVRYMRQWYEPRGRTESKVLTLHALDDGLVIPENEEKYRQAFAAAGRADQLVQITTTAGGHCRFVGELLAIVPAMTGWVEEGRTPSTASFQASCAGCSVTTTTPGTMGLRIPERKQRGAPLRAMVCDADPGECPAGTTCSPRGRCRP